MDSFEKLKNFNDMRYPTKVLVSCFALIVVVGIVCFYPEGSNSTVCCDSNVSNSSTTAQANEGMTRPFSPLLKVEIDESVREDMYQSAKKIRDKRWSPIHDVNKGADAHKIFNALFLSTTIPLWRVPNVWTEDGDFLYLWYSEASLGYCIDKKILTYSMWQFDSPPVFFSKEKPVLSRFPKPKHFQDAEKQEAEASED